MNACSPGDRVSYIQKKNHAARWHACKTEWLSWTSSRRILCTEPPGIFSSGSESEAPFANGKATRITTMTATRPNAPAQLIRGQLSARHHLPASRARCHNSPLPRNDGAQATEAAISFPAGSAWARAVIPFLWSMPTDNDGVRLRLFYQRWRSTGLRHQSCTHLATTIDDRYFTVDGASIVAKRRERTLRIVDECSRSIEPCAAFGGSCVTPV
jgi:hypothetical protein